MVNVECPFCGRSFESVQGQSADHPVGTCPLSGDKLAVEQWRMRPPSPIPTEVEYLRSLVAQLVLEPQQQNYSIALDPTTYEAKGE